MQKSIKERPILFSAPMVRALLDGSKTQTRRAIKIQPSIDSMGHFIWNEMNFGQEIDGKPCVRNLIKFHCPYGKVGDRLWVRETWMPDPSCDDDAWDDAAISWHEWDGCGMPMRDYPDALKNVSNVIYRASWDGQEMVGWKPSIHMPRWASRINLEITAVRVERLNDISEADAKAEGVLQVESDGYQNYDGTGGYWGSAINSFETLWESINGAGSWQENPFVWVIEFKVVK